MDIEKKFYYLRYLILGVLIMAMAGFRSYKNSTSRALESAPKSKTPVTLAKTLSNNPLKTT